MYMLLQVDKEENEYVSGTHLQWCCACLLHDAMIRAIATEKANGDRITVAIVDILYNPYACGAYYKMLKRLDRR